MIDKEHAQRWYISQYHHGYTEGKRNIPYSGETFIGYYGWLDAKEGMNPRYRRNNEG